MEALSEACPESASILFASVYKASEKHNIHQRQPRDSLICGGLGVEVEFFSTGHIADAMRSRGPGTCNPGKQGGSPVGGGEISEI